jgi:hypothetical protein
MIESSRRNNVDLRQTFPDERLTSLDDDGVVCVWAIVYSEPVVGRNTHPVEGGNSEKPSLFMFRIPRAES